MTKQITMTTTLLAQAQAFVDRKYVVTADERQKEMGLGYVTAERTDLAREIASFTASVEGSAVERIDNASQAASETQPSWKHRCFRIMGALGLDYGDPDWVIPDEQKKLDVAEARIAELETKLAESEKRINGLRSAVRAEGYA
ncbi:hypothetical protein IVB43_37185 [Bradyrhizobium sp. 48]|uniref:hypothetical protein n=1 Tax=Bradyrhizobium sp. 48 TaxID=2782676 RepID=UPI001FF91D60|nr:hypothetical protein [Bradyrhizobium sp. 48]MCK1447998.1 hypothetical protein [Bradyrhizobium sp. 48]